MVLYKISRREFVNYSICMPILSFIFPSKTYSCGNPIETFIPLTSFEEVVRDKELSEYLKNKYKENVEEDINNIINIETPNAAESSENIPIQIYIKNNTAKEICKKLDIYIDSNNTLLEESQIKKVNLKYKLGEFSFHNNGIPYISTRFRAVSRDIRIIVVARIYNGENSWNIQSDPIAINVVQCGGFIFTESGKLAKNMADCSREQWEFSSKSCKKLLTTYGWGKK